MRLSHDETVGLFFGLKSEALLPSIQNGSNPMVRRRYATPTRPVSPNCSRPSCHRKSARPRSFRPADLIQSQSMSITFHPFRR